MCFRLVRYRPELQDAAKDHVAKRHTSGRASFRQHPVSGATVQRVLTWMDSDQALVLV